MLRSFYEKLLFLFSDGNILFQSPVNGYYESLYLDHGGTLFWSDERLKSGIHLGIYRASFAFVLRRPLLAAEQGEYGLSPHPYEANCIEDWRYAG